MQAWNEWMHSLGEGLKDGGNPFGPAAKTIAADGSVTDGAAAKGCPVLQGGATISVYETFAVM